MFHNKKCSSICLLSTLKLATKFFIFHVPYCSFIARNYNYTLKCYYYNVPLSKWRWSSFLCAVQFWCFFPNFTEFLTSSIKKLKRRKVPHHTLPYSFPNGAFKYQKCTSLSTQCLVLQWHNHWQPFFPFWSQIKIISPNEVEGYWLCKREKDKLHLVITRPWYFIFHIVILNIEVKNSLFQPCCQYWAVTLQLQC